MKKGKAPKLWVITTAVLGGLSAVLIVANIVGEINAATINWALNAETSKVVGEGEKNIYFHSDYATGVNSKTGKETIDTKKLADDGDALAEEVAEEGFVLLQNKNNALPLAADSKVSVFGQSSAHIVTSGTGSGATSGNTATIVSAMKKGGLNLVQESYKFYTEGAGKNYTSSVPGMHDSKPFHIGECPWNVISSDANFSTIASADTAVVVFSRNGGEGFDLSNGASEVGYDSGLINCDDALSVADGSLTGNNYLELNKEERSILKGLKEWKASNTNRKVVVLLNSSNAMQLDFLKNPDFDVDACIWIGATGQSGINAIGSILSGKVNPSGRLVDTYCYDNLREPSIYNFGHNAYSNFDTDFLAKSMAEGDDFKFNQKYYNVYREGIYVGERYYETRYADYVLGNTDDFDYDGIVANSFGNGLSYSKFEYTNFAVMESEDKKSYDVKVTVTNKGDIAGKEVVQVYGQTPYSEYAIANGMEKASIQLVGFEKTDLLEKNAHQDITINVPKEYLASYDANKAKTYVMDEGDYFLSLGDGAHDALNRILREHGADSSKIVEAQSSFTSVDDLVYKFNVSSTDAMTYAISSTTGAAITNQFDNADLNKYAGNDDQTINYVTRKNWKQSFDDTSLETMKATHVSLKMTDAMYQDVINEQYNAPEAAKDAVMPKMGVKNGLKLAEFVSVPRDGKIKKGSKEYTWDDLLDQLSFKDMNNLISVGQHTTKVIPSVGKPGTSDQNGPSGFSSTFVGGGTGTAFPAPAVRAATFNKKLAKRVGAHIGEDGLASGCNGLYGPAANTHRNAYCGRNFEYYSEDPILSSLFGAEEVKGIQSKGIIVYEKHFALNDFESHREGVGVWANEQSIRQIYLEAFHTILKKDGGNAHAIMSGFNRLGTIWTGDHDGIMNKVARGEWGFDGFIITDADSNNKGVLNTGYMFAPRAITTGTDIYDGNDNMSRTAQLNKYIKDAYVVSCMREASARILYTVANSAAMNGTSSTSEVVEIMPWWQVTALSIMSVFLALTAVSSIFLILNMTGVMNFPKKKETGEISIEK